MTKKLGKKISAAIFFVSFFVGNFFVPSAEVQAAGSDCCVYVVVPATKPPQWLMDLGAGSMWFQDVAVGQPCKPASAIPILAQKKIDKYYDNNEGYALGGSCGNTADYKSFVAAVQNNGCCEITNNTGALRSCSAINKADALSSATASSCLLAAYNQFLDVPNGDKLIAHKKDCTAVTSCQDLQKKIETVKADNKTAADNAAAQQKAAADLAAMVAGGKTRLPWTKAECIAVLQKGSTEQQYDWIPPKSDLNTQIGDYCYIKQLPTKMQVDIGSTGVISGLPQYINIAYKYALGIGVIVMIVVIVFSGIQWMLSGAISSINNSKDRIKNAALGLLLLFGANTILYTINPQLLNLKLPPMHAIRSEKFEVAQTAGAEGVRCDPGEANACADKGANFKCKPTAYYTSDKCLSQANGFMALVVGGAAIATAGPFIVSAGATAIAKEGAGKIVKEIAFEAAENIVTDTVTGGQTSAAEHTAEAAVTTGGSKAKLILGGIAVVAGLAFADNLYSDYKEGQKPANGYCVEMKHDLPDHSVCQADGDCASDKCLITSSGACGAGKFGICTSGKIRQACMIPNNFQKDLIDFLTVGAGTGTGTETITMSAIEKKYGCNDGKCVDNGRGATKSGVGICSDGSDIGLPCGDGVTCKSPQNNLECSNGFCREKGFFGTSGKINGLVMSIGDFKPRCMLPTDCSDFKSVMTADTYQGTYEIGCLKPPSSELKLPGRLLVSQKNQKIEPSFYTELSTYGSCVTNKVMFKNYDMSSGDPKLLGEVAQPCYVNFYPTSKFDPDSKTVADYLATKQSLPTGVFSTFDIKKVGCGKAGVCTIKPSDIATAPGTTAFKSVRGVCQNELSNNAKAAIVKDAGGNEKVGVVELDDDYSQIKFPNIIDLEYTYAGTAQGAGD